MGLTYLSADACPGTGLQWGAHLSTELYVIKFARAKQQSILHRRELSQCNPDNRGF